MKSSVKSKKGKLNPYILPILFILGLLPFIIHLKIYDTHLENNGFFSSAQDVDIFLYYKSWAFVIICSLMLLLTIAQAFLKHKKLKFSKLFIPLAAYALLSILSAIFSKYKPFSFTGIWDQFESLWVLLGYAVTVYYCFIFVTSSFDVSSIMAVLTVGTILMLLLGLSQAFSKDILRTEFGRWIILPDYLYQNPEAKLDFKFPLGRVYLTLFNPNYVGTYVALLAPVFLMLTFVKKGIVNSIINIVIFVGLLLCILGSGSRAGFVGVALSILLILAIYNKKLLKFIPEALIVAILIIGIVITYNNYTNGQLLNRLKSALSIEPTEHNLTSIETNDDNIVIHYRDDELKVSHEIDEASDFLMVSLFDKNNESVNYNIDPDTEGGGYGFTTDDARFSNISFFFYYINHVPVYNFTIDGANWQFIYLDNTYYYFNDKNKATKIRNSEKIDFLDKYSKVASGRFFIWSRTIPLLKDNIFLGSGPDTFLLEFPNDDYVAMRGSSYADQHITKPHNMYLQIAVQTGLVSLICFLAFYIWYFISSIKIYRKADKTKYITMVGIGILSGTLGYMIVGLINDSMVVTAPLFWTLIGIGLAINYMIKRDNLFTKIETVSETNSIEPDANSTMSIDSDTESTQAENAEDTAESNSISDSVSGSTSDSTPDSADSANDNV